jgi:hypothetical protein
MGSAEIQGELWGARAREWAHLQESSFWLVFEDAFSAAHLIPAPQRSTWAVVPD